MATISNEVGRTTIERRAYWISEIAKISGRFTDDTERLQAEIRSEIEKEGAGVLLDHLRMCGHLPECYRHDSSEEKLYSKYTDILLSETFISLGLKSIVITERADAADVEAVAGKYSFVADAKAFRLSRTAKNQKDFKVEAMHSWKRGKPFAVVVCPLYQLPRKSSQIYLQAIARDVLILSYTQLSVLLKLALNGHKAKAEHCFEAMFRVVASLNPSKESLPYWASINKTMLSYHKDIPGIWKEEKIALLNSIAAAKEEGLSFLSAERERIMRFSHEEAIRHLIKEHNLDSRAKMIQSVCDNGIMELA